MPLRRGPQWSQNKRGPRAHAAGAAMIPTRRRPRGRCSGGLGGPIAEEAPTPMRRGPRWSQSKGGPHALAQGAWVVLQQRRPLRQRSGGPRCSQSEGGPKALAQGASVVPKRKRAGTPSLPSHWVSLSPHGPHRTGGTGVAADREGWVTETPSSPSQRVSHPHTTRTGPGRLGCNHQHRGIGGRKPFTPFPSGIPSPARPPTGGTRVYPLSQGVGLRGGVPLNVPIPPDHDETGGLGYSCRPGNPKPHSHPIRRPHPRAAI